MPTTVEEVPDAPRPVREPVGRMPRPRSWRRWAPQPSGGGDGWGFSSCCSWPPAPGDGWFGRAARWDEHPDGGAGSSAG